MTTAKTLSGNDAEGANTDFTVSQEINRRGSREKIREKRVDSAEGGYSSQISVTENDRIINVSLRSLTL